MSRFVKKNRIAHGVYEFLYGNLMNHYFMSLTRRFVDYHVHSNHSCDGKSSIFEMCQRAIELGIEEIGFSEHMDFEPKDWGFGFFNYDSYTAEIKRAQESFENRLTIRKGVEIDYQHCFEDDIKNWLQNKKFDFVVGSVHYLDHEIIDRRLLTKKDLTEVYRAYFDEVAYSIESGLFDVVGHLDLVRTYVGKGRAELERFNYWERIKTILKEVAQRRTYLEVNSKGLREEVGDTIPSMEIVNEYFENGGTLVSIGSDAHSTEEMGNGIKDILDFLANCNRNKVKLLFE